jgi:predicted dehydrogenase
MERASVRWGIVSTANIGRAVIPALHAASHAEVVAVASRDGERARAFADELSIPTAYSAYEALLEADNIDAVYIPLPNSLHRDWAIRFAEAGKHVLCEKPLALDAAECAEMSAAAAANGVCLMEAFMYRFHPRTEKVIDLVRNGVIGPLQSLTASFTFPLSRAGDIRNQPELGGGALMDVGCYCVNVARTLANAEPIEVQATANWSNTGVDDQMAGTLRFDSGLLAQLECALTLPRRQHYEAAGRDGYLQVASAFRPDGDDTDIVVYDSEGNEPEVHRIANNDEYRLMVEHFTHCVVTGTDPRYPVAEAAANMRVIEALYRAARSGKSERVS